MIEKKPFVRYTLEDDNSTSYSRSIWTTPELRQLIFDVGCRLRQKQLSTIIKQSLEIAQANLIANEKISEILYANGRTCSRSGLDEIDLVKKELRQVLSKSHSKI